MSALAFSTSAAEAALAMKSRTAWCGGADHFAHVNSSANAL